MPLFPLVAGQTYWLRHARFGTHPATLRLASPNPRSLAFKVEHRADILAE